MKVLFIWTDVDTHIESGLIHIGVAYLSAFLKRAGHDTSLIRVTTAIEKEDFLNRVAAYDPDVVAFTVVTNQFEYNVMLADWLKERSNLPVIFGGSHATLAPDETIAQKSVDMICRGEGGEALTELVDRMSAGRDYTGVANFWVKKDGKIHRNDLRPLLADLNEIPFMDVDIFDLNSMFEGGINLHFMAGRGCPYQCTYCCSPAFTRLYRGKGKIVRFRRPEVAVAELKQHKERYPRISYFTGQDETFTLYKDWTLEFCEIYKRELGIPFSTMVRVNHLDEDILRALKDAGADMIRVGLESGSPWLREHVLKRKTSNEQFHKIFDLADKIGIRTWAFVILGLPHETPEMIEQTMDLTRRLNPNQVQLSIFYPYPGTELYDECRREGWMTDEKSRSYFEKPILKLPTISQQQIMDYHNSFSKELVEIAAKKEGVGCYDFITRIGEAKIKTDSDDFVGLTTFFEEYPQRYWLQAHPFTEISYDIDLPKDGSLVFDIAVNPDTYDKEGSGVKFEITKNGKKIFSKRLNPKKKTEDRGWFHYELPLNGGGPSRLVFTTRAASRSNNYFCTAGWGRPHLSKSPPGESKGTGA